MFELSRKALVDLNLKNINYNQNIYFFKYVYMYFRSLQFEPVKIEIFVKLCFR